MQMIKRLKSLALAAIALAFAQLPALAADPEVSTDPNEPRYSIDGGSNWYKLGVNQWLSVISQYRTFKGATSSSQRVGGTAEKRDLIVVANMTYSDTVRDFCEPNRIQNHWSGDTPIIIQTSDCIDYLTICFSNCEFRAGADDKKEKFTFKGGGCDGNELAFKSCKFYGVSVYGLNDADPRYNGHFDVSFDDCDFRGAVNNVGDGGCWFGDVTIRNCRRYGTERLVNLTIASDVGVKSGINSLGAEATFLVDGLQVIVEDGDELPPWAYLFIVNYGTNIKVDNLTGVGTLYCYNTQDYKLKVGNLETYIKDCPITYKRDASDYPWIVFVTPAKVTYDKNGGNVEPQSDDNSYKFREEATAKSTSGLSKGGQACIGWSTSAEATEPEYIAGDKIVILDNVKLYAIYGEAPREPTGQYRISCLENKATPVQKELGLTQGVDENGNEILYKDYPWYSDENWMTNVYDTVKTVWGNGSSDDPLTVTVWGKETTPGSGVREPLLLGDGDMTTEKILEGGFTGASCLYNDSTIVWTTFVFDNCIWTESGVKTGDDKCGRYVIYETAGGVDFVFKDGIMTNSVSTYECELTYNVGLTFDGVRFEKTCGYIQYFAANVDFRNCTFAAGYYNKIVQAKYEGWFDEWETSGGNSSDTSDDALAAYTNNIWEAVSPGQWLVQFGNYDYAQFGDSKICTDATGFTGLHVDMKVYDGTWDEKPDDDQTKTNETFVAYDQKDVNNYRRQVRVVVHPVTVKFVPDAGAETNFYAVVGLSDLWTSTGDRYQESDADVGYFPDVSTPGNLWYEESDRTTGYTLEELRAAYDGFLFTEDLTFIEGKPIAPELVGTLKMPSFVKGLDPTQPSGLFWRMGENGDLYPLALKDGEMPKYEYYIYTDAECKNHVELEGGNQATVDQLKLLEPGTYYVRGEVRDFKPYKYSGELLSAAAEFTVVDPDDYPDYMFVQWIEMTGCQCVNTKVNPSRFYTADGALEGKDFRKFGFGLDFEDYNPTEGSWGTVIMGTGPWGGFDYKGNTPGLWFTDADRNSSGLGSFSYLYKGYNYINSCLLYRTRVQVQLTNQWYSISSPTDVEWRGTNVPNRTDVSGDDDIGKVFGLPFVLSGRLVSPEYDHDIGLPEGEDGGRWQDVYRRGYLIPNQLRHYSLRFYHDGEVVFEALPAIDKKTGRRGLLKIRGLDGIGQEFVYSSNVADGTNTANKAMEAARSAMAGHLDGPLGIHELKTPLLNFEDWYGAEMFQNVRVLPGRVAETIEGLVADQLHQYPDTHPDMTSGYWVGSLDEAAYRVLYSTDKGAVFTNIVFDATNDVKKTDMAALAAWSPEPPADATEFKVAILTAVSKPLVREVTVMRGITVTLNANGGKYGDGEETAKLEAMPGEPMAELADVQIPTRVDEDGNEYTFIGYFDKSGEQYYDKDGKPTKDTYPETDIDLYAHWVNSEYDVIGYLQNWDPVKPDSRAGYVDLGENVHLSGDNLVGLKYCLETNGVAYQNIFMTRTKNDNKYTEYGLVWSKNPNPGIKFHYVKETTDTYNSGMWTADDKACATEADLSVWLDGAANGGNCLLDGEPYKWDSGNITLFDSEIEQKILLFVADNQDACDGTPEVMTDAAESNRINYCMIGKMYYFKVLDSADNRELKLDLVPVTNKTTGVRGFYDTLTEAFYPLRMPIQLHYENGTGNSEYVYSVKGEELPVVTPPKYAGHVFLGYFDSEGTKYYDADGKGVRENPYTEAADLYACWKLACPLELFIAAHAHTADVDSKQYVYLAVQPSFATALTDAAFSTWLNEAKDGNAFKVCVSDDGETFGDAIEVTLDDSGAHKYDADKEKRWVWMKVDISAAKDADKKYWKAMFVTPEPAQPAPESAD